MRQRSICRLRQSWGSVAGWKRAIAASISLCFIIQCAFGFSLWREYSFRVKLTKRFRVGLSFTPRQLAVAQSLSRFVSEDILELLASIEGVTIAHPTDDDLRLVAQRPSLKYLNLYTGNLSPAGLKQIGLLSNVEDLYLENDCVDPQSLAALPQCVKLRRLKIVGRISPEALRPLRQSLSISELHLTSQRQDPEILERSLDSITGLHLAAVAQIPNLQKLTIYSAGVLDSDLNPLAEAKRIEKLFVHYVQIQSRSLNSLGKMPRLKVLSLDLDTAGYMEPLEGFSMLTALALHGARVSPEFLRGLEKLPCLETLSFEGCWVNESLSGLAGNVKLKRLNLEASDVNVEGVRQIGRLASLEVLDGPEFEDAEGIQDLFPRLHAGTPFDWEAALMKQTSRVLRHTEGGGFF